jgi:putative oxidoreductase
MLNNLGRVSALIGRVVIGLFFAYYGVNNLIDFGAMTGYATFKGVPIPSIAVIVGAILLLIGGGNLLLDYRPVIGIAALVLFLLPVSMLMHNFWSVTDPQMRVIEQGLWMRNIALVGAALFMLAIPRPWLFSLDELLAQTKTHSTTSGKNLANV